MTDYKLKIDLRAVIYKDNDLDVWICHCLEMGVLGHGDSKLNAFKMMKQAVETQVEESIRIDNLDNIFMAADPQIQVMYAKGENTTIDGVLQLNLHEQIPTNNNQSYAVLDFVGTRQYPAKQAVAN